MRDHFKEVRAIFMEHFAVVEEDIAMETELVELGMDSLDEVEIELDGCQLVYQSRDKPIQPEPHSGDCEQADQDCLKW